MILPIFFSFANIIDSRNIVYGGTLNDSNKLINSISFINSINNIY